MNKPEQQNADGPADTADASKVSWQTITETMERPEFTPEQLPELWQQAVEPGGIRAGRVGAWNDGIETMYRRCETYPQHTKIAVILSGTPHGSWHETGWTVAQADDLAHQATPEQIQQALTCEQQHPGGWWRASDHILTWATVAQLTGQVIEQLPWNNRFLDYATTTEQYQAMEPHFEQARSRRRQRIVEHIQQRLLNGNNNAWAVFLGIVGQGTVIGSAIELANAVEHQYRRVQNET